MYKIIKKNIQPIYNKSNEMVGSHNNSKNCIKSIEFKSMKLKMIFNQKCLEATYDAPKYILFNNKLIKITQC